MCTDGSQNHWFAQCIPKLTLHLHVMRTTYTTLVCFIWVSKDIITNNVQPTVNNTKLLGNSVLKVEIKSENARLSTNNSLRFGITKKSIEECRNACFLRSKQLKIHLGTYHPKMYFTSRNRIGRIPVARQIVHFWAKWCYLIVSVKLLMQNHSSLSSATARGLGPWS